LNVLKALATVVGTAIGVGAAGTALGVLLGKFAPSFYRQMIPLREPESFDAVELGIGLGLINGLIWGLVVGILMVAILSWKETRRPRKNAEVNAP